MKDFNVTKYFKRFDKKLRTSERNEEKISNRMKKITGIINQAYWEFHSENLHSLLVGSYGRGTAIHLSDIDLLVELPLEQKERFEQYIGNGQSALLQDIKHNILKYYSNSRVKGDGQIVSIEFSDGIRFEILPAFKVIGTEIYEYPDTNEGGDWKETNPKLEKSKLTERNIEKRRVVKKFCRMVRAWNDTNSIGLHGIAIDSLVYNFFEFRDSSTSSYEYFDLISNDFFKYILKFIENKEVLFSIDGSYTIQIPDIKMKVKNACAESEFAIANKNNTRISEKHWCNVFGEKFPILEVEKNKTNNLLISNRANREPIGNARDTEQFADEMGWDIDVERIVEIHSNLEVNGFRKGRIIQRYAVPIRPNSKINFSVLNVPGIEWYWKVRNVGIEAIGNNLIRGQIIKRSSQISEPIKFKGNHYVEVYGVRGKKVRLFGRIEVPLEENHE